MVWVPVQSALTKFVPVPGSVLNTALMRSKVAIGRLFDSDEYSGNRI
jgi:hypothetical protein